MSTGVRWLIGIVGLLLLVGVPTVWFVSQPAESAGELPETLAVDGPDDPASGGLVEQPPDHLDLSVDDRGRAEPVDDTNDTAPATLPEATATSARPPKPVSVSLPGIEVQAATVVEVGLDDNRAVEIPDDVRQVGWYGKGPRPGEDGNAFMTSHVDSLSQGRGVLFDLRRSEPGDPIVVTHDDGSISEWTVVARERIRKGSYPMEQVFRFDGPPGLVIDTCGGAFDASRGSYEQIDIVYAVPADVAPDDEDTE